MIIQWKAWTTSKYLSSEMRRPSNNHSQNCVQENPLPDFSLGETIVFLTRGRACAGRVSPRPGTELATRSHDSRARREVPQDDSSLCVYK